MNALIVEDNELQSRTLSELLKEDGFTPVIAEHGRKALRILEAQHFDVIVSDVYMPVMDGLEFLQIVKKLEKLKNIPFIMYSSKPIGSDIGLAHKLGVDCFVEEAGIRGVPNAVQEVLKQRR